MTAAREQGAGTEVGIAQGLFFFGGAEGVSVSMAVGECDYCRPIGKDLKALETLAHIV